MARALTKLATVGVAGAIGLLLIRSIASNRAAAETDDTVEIDGAGGGGATQLPPLETVPAPPEDTEETPPLPEPPVETPAPPPPNPRGGGHGRGGRRTGPPPRDHGIPPPPHPGRYDGSRDLGPARDPALLRRNREYLNARGYDITSQGHVVRIGGSRAPRVISSGTGGARSSGYRGARSAAGRTRFAGGAPRTLRAGPVADPVPRRVVRRSTASPYSSRGSRVYSRASPTLTTYRGRSAPPPPPPPRGQGRHVAARELLRRRRTRAPTSSRSRRSISAVARARAEGRRQSRAPTRGPARRPTRQRTTKTILAAYAAYRGR